MEKELQFVHKELYGTAMELAKKFVSKYEARPLLHYAYHRNNGDLIATDSMKLIHFKNIHGFKEDVLINPRNLMAASGDYPRIDSVTGKDKHKDSITLNSQHIKVWLQMFKSFNQLMKTMKVYSKVVKLNFYHDSIETELSNFEVRVRLPFEIYSKPKLNAISFDIEYMKDVLEVFSKVNSEEVNILFRSELTPIILEDEKVVKAVVLPVRTY